MPAATRVGDECTGHGCWPPRVCDQGSPNVFANGLGVNRTGDHWLEHCCGPACHDSISLETSGASSVFINGKAAMRIGDEIECGSVSAQGSPNVFIGNTPVVPNANPVPAVSYKITVANTISPPAETLVPLSSAQISGLATSTAAAANDPNAAEVGLSNKGEVPQEGTPQEISPAPSNVTGDTIFARLANIIDSCLAQAAKGEWKENGSNPNILGCYKAAGSNLSNDKTPWCAAFATNALKLAGAPAKATLSSLAYRGHGTPVDLNDKTKWRLNDIVVFTRDGGGHIGFFRGYNPSNGSILIAGGNQSDNLTEKGFKAGGMPVAYVGRAWDVPAEYDKPVTYNGTGGSVKVV